VKQVKHGLKNLEASNPHLTDLPHFLSTLVDVCLLLVSSAVDKQKQVIYQVLLLGHSHKAYNVLCRWQINVESIKIIIARVSTYLEKLWGATISFGLELFAEG